MGQTGMTRIFDKTLIVGLALVVVLLFLSIGVAYRNIQYLHDHSRGVAAHVSREIAAVCGSWREIIPFSMSGPISAEACCC